MTATAKKETALQARLHEGVLVLDVPRAKTPGVLRLKLNDVTLAQFHVRSTDQGSILGFSTGRDDFNILAVFTDRVDADAALAALREALMRPCCHKHGLSRRVLLVVAGVSLALFLLMFFANLISVSHPRLPPLEEPVALDDEAPPAQPGMPVDADSKLAPPH